MNCMVRPLDMDMLYISPATGLMVHYPRVVDVEGLKEVLSANTLVGEVVDLEKAQHIVDNPKRHGLIFFALVTIEPSEKGVPLIAEPIFAKHGLQCVDAGDSWALLFMQPVLLAKFFLLPR